MDNEKNKIRHESLTSDTHYSTGSRFFNIEVISSKKVIMLLGVSFSSGLVGTLDYGPMSL